ncbi:Sec-independent protein translocase family protein [Yaniella halotolerans]|uniref:preprotein translocase subunit TatA n=1 Tax=Yaniella halotolerans TaxID=225453 RepID=UPI0003B68489|nr:preprotein translocase subunit TatA [Yaniella halotolerans]
MNIFGINGGELIVLIVLALMLLGPEKIPQYLRTLREWIHKARVFAEGAKDQFKEETGTDFDEVDWQKYDPRQYDPRRVIREALSEPIEDIEASMKDAKNTVQDAADTVTQKPIARPALSQAEIMAAAVPIDQLEQQSQFPDPSQPKPSADAARTEPQEADQPVLENPVDQVAAEDTTELTADNGPEAPAVLGTPFDAEAT